MQYAKSLYIQPDPSNPTKHKYTLEKISQLICKKFQQKVPANTLGSWASRNQWKKEWEEAQLQGSIQASKQTQQKKQEIQEEYTQSIIQNKSQYLEDIQAKIQKALSKVDEVLSSGVNPENVVMFERLCKGITALQNAITNMEEVEKKYSYIQPDKDQIITIQLDDEWKRE